MIEIIVCQNCPHCDRQIEEMCAFASHEYHIIEIESEEFAEYDMKDKVDGVPFIIVRDEKGHPIISEAGFKNSKQLKQALFSRPKSKIFNLSKRNN